MIDLDQLHAVMDGRFNVGKTTAMLICSLADRMEYNPVRVSRTEIKIGKTLYRFVFRGQKYNVTGPAVYVDHRASEKDFDEMKRKFYEGKKTSQKN